MTQPAPSQTPLRFVHASDLHLERPLGGVAEVPEDLREIFLEAPFLAAKQLFETVLAEGADALLLAGDVVDVEMAGPRAVLFLTEQFGRLADHGVPVYWACGDADPADAWPACAELPENVHRFSVGRVETIELSCDIESEEIESEEIEAEEAEFDSEDVDSEIADDTDEYEATEVTVARVQGISRSQGAAMDDRGFHRDAHGLFTLGVSYGTAASPGAEGDRVHYMALGGQHHRQTVDQSPGIAHYSGTPQGRSPDEPGPHGCTVVSVDEVGHVKTRFVSTDVVRWLTETIEITAGTDEQSLLHQFDGRVARLREKHADVCLLITWRIEGKGPLLYQLRPGGLTEKLLDRLRKKHGKECSEGGSGAWSVAIECDATLDVPAEWHDQETIMGDLLRQIQQLDGDADIPLELEEFLPDEFRDGSYAELATVATAEDRQTLLRESAKLGIDVITIEE